MTYVQVPVRFRWKPCDHLPSSFLEVLGQPLWAVGNAHDAAITEVHPGVYLVTRQVTHQYLQIQWVVLDHSTQVLKPFCAVCNGAI
jgi:hypothetical protein